MELFASHPTGLGKLILFFPALMGCLFHNSLPTTPGRRGSEPSPQQHSASPLSPPRAVGPSAAPQIQPRGLGCVSAERAQLREKHPAHLCGVWGSAAGRASIPVAAMQFWHGSREPPQVSPPSPGTGSRAGGCSSQVLPCGHASVLQREVAPGQRVWGWDVHRALPCRDSAALPRRRGFGLTSARLVS